jgi:hypothetical protein
MMPLTIDVPQRGRSARIIAAAAPRDAEEVVVAERRERSSGIDRGGVQDLRPPDVADVGEGALIEQGVADRARRVERATTSGGAGQTGLDPAASKERAPCEAFGKAQRPRPGMVGSHLRNRAEQWRHPPGNAPDRVALGHRLLRSSQMLFAFLRPGRLISLLLLGGIIVGGWWAWSRLHRSEPASLAAALTAVRDAEGPENGPPLPGVYRYASGGDERIGIGPLSVGRSLPTEALLVVRPGPTTREVEFRISADHAEGWRIERGEDGIKGVARTIRVGTLGYTRQVSGSAEPPPLLRPAKFKRNMEWSDTYTVAGIVFRRESKVVDRQVMTIAGRTVRTWVIEVRETVTGALHGSDERKEWWSPTLGIDVRVEWHRDFDGTIVNIVSDTLELQAIDPIR